MEAQDIMTVDVDTVHEDDEVRDVLTRLGRVNYSGFPVIDDKGRVVGVVTEHDLVDVFQPHDKTLWIPIGFPPFLETMTYGFELPWDEIDIGLDLVRLAGQSISTLMTSPAVTVNPDTPLNRVIELLADQDQDINRLPVVDTDNRIAGIITRQDVLRTISERGLIGG
jgi:CBS domain-containing protein